MTTSPTGPLGSPTSSERVALRIQLCAGAPSGAVDGAWWPQSRDLQREAADLVDHFPPLAGRIERLLFSRPDWDAVSEAPSARRIRTARGAVKVGSFPRDDTHLMVAKLSSGQRLRLLVVPSSTEPGRAAELMRQAVDHHNTRSASALLDASRPH